MKITATCHCGSDLRIDTTLPNLADKDREGAARTVTRWIGIHTSCRPNVPTAPEERERLEEASHSDADPGL